MMICWISARSALNQNFNTPSFQSPHGVHTPSNTEEELRQISNFDTTTAFLRT